MVRDNEIKATVSPFAIRPGEIKVFDGKRWLCINEPNSTEDKLRTYK